MTTDTITLYYAPLTRAERVKRLLDAFSIPHEVVTIDYLGGQQKSAEYMENVHPLGRVPALKHGDQVLLESGAICLYLADLYLEKKMAPPVGSRDRGKYYEWIFLFLTTLEPLALAAGDEAKRAECAAEMKESLTALARRIEGPFLLGEEFTAADVMVHTELTWYRMLEIYPEGIELLDQFYQRVEERLNRSS